MTAPQASRTTLADLIPLIENANLSPIQKRDQISAVRTLARLLGAELRDIAAECGEVATSHGSDRAGGSGTFEGAMDEHSVARRQGAGSGSAYAAGASDRAAPAGMGGPVRIA